MRVLMLSQFFHPAVGGEERVVQELAGGLSARGHDVAVATLQLDGAPRREELAGVRVHRLDAAVNHVGWLYEDRTRRHLPPAPDPLLVAGLRDVLSEERPDVVHAHNWIVHSYLPLKRRGGVPLALSLHDYSLSCANKRLVRSGAVCSGPGPWKCLRCAADYYGPAKGAFVAGTLSALAPSVRRRVDAYLPVSEAVADALGLARRGLPYEVVPNPLPDAFADARPPDPQLTVRLPSDGFLLFLGDATADKGVRVLLEAHQQLAPRPPLVFVGRPLDLDDRHVPAGVEILGLWPHGAAQDAIRRCSLLVVPSLWSEPFGMVALEAMALGRPVVASDTGGLRDLVVDGVTGRLVPPGDVRALRDALAELLADPARRATMGEMGRQRAAEFAAENVVPRLERVYGGLVAGGGRGVDVAG